MKRSPQWSPDGTRVAYFSDASGEYELHVATHDGKGDVKKYKLAGAGFYSDLRWSPDSQKVAFADNSQSVWWLDLAAGTMKRIGGNRVYGPISPLAFDFRSPDSKWLACVVTTQALVNTVFGYSLEQDKSFAITDGLSEVAELLCGYIVFSGLLKNFSADSLKSRLSSLNVKGLGGWWKGKYKRVT